jgi:hypothetical protein
MQYLWPIFAIKKALKDHKDKNHRITNSKMMTIATGITSSLLLKVFEEDR